jgi:phage terminase Nu1 subunit (DNA packaging protein)
MLTPAGRQARARLASAAAAAKRRPLDADADAAVRLARRDYAAQALAEHIRNVVDSAPPLTPEQRDRLAVLLRPGAA